MDGIVFDLIGMILQVLGLMIAFGSLTVEAVGLVLQMRSKDSSRSSHKEDERDSNNIRTAIASPRAVGS